jgi:hypothetical protein
MPALGDARRRGGQSAQYQLIALDVQLDAIPMHR